MPPDYTQAADQRRRDEWIECPRCRSVMLPLSEYEIQSSEFQGADIDLWEFLVWGWMAFVYSFVLNLLGFGGQKAKLAKLKKDTLPSFPASLICPRCFYVLKAAFTS